MPYNPYADSYYTTGANNFGNDFKANNYDGADNAARFELNSDHDKHEHGAD